MDGCRRVSREQGARPPSVPVSFAACRDYGELVARSLTRRRVRERRVDDARMRATLHRRTKKVQTGGGPGFVAQSLVRFPHAIKRRGSTRRVDPRRRTGRSVLAVGCNSIRNKTGLPAFNGADHYLTREMRRPVGPWNEELEISTTTMRRGGSRLVPNSGRYRPAAVNNSWRRVIRSNEIEIFACNGYKALLSRQLTFGNCDSSLSQPVGVSGRFKRRRKISSLPTRRHAHVQHGRYPGITEDVRVV